MPRQISFENSNGVHDKHQDGGLAYRFLACNNGLLNTD